MSKRVAAAFLSALLIVMMISSPAMASSDRNGSCPDGFKLHPADHHGHDDQHGEHLHVGVDSDKNGDGLTSGKHVGVDGTVLVHIDNNAR